MYRKRKKRKNAPNPRARVGKGKTNLWEEEEEWVMMIDAFPPSIC
jgi:hypothetical protein